MIAESSAEKKAGLFLQKKDLPVSNRKINQI